MSNSFATPSLIGKYVLAYLQTNCVAAQLMDRQYDNSFGSTGLSAWKSGSTLKVKYPVQFTSTTGPGLALQDITQQTGTITVATQRHIDFDYLSIEEALTLSQIKEQFFEPAGKTLASLIDQDSLSFLTPTVYNVVGETAAATTGALPASFSVVNKARQFLSQNLAPKTHPWNLIVDPASMTSVANALTGFYNPQAAISEDFRLGMVAKQTAGFDWYETQNVKSQTYGTRTATGATVNGTPADGATTITLAGAGNAKTYVVGDRFTVANCYPVNPESKNTYGSTLQWFVVTAAATSSAGGAVTLSVSPTIYQSGALQNMTGLVSTSAVTFWGNAGLTAINNVAFAKDAFAFVSVAPPNVGGVEMCHVERQNDIAIRVLIDYDPVNDRKICRIDAIYGFAALYPQLACIVSG